MSAQAFKIFRETALPTTLQPYAIYLIAPASAPNFVEMYVTSSAGVARRIINAADIEAMISQKIASATELQIVTDIAARDALTPTSTKYVYVINASADASVASGGATYLYNPSNSLWIKISESESLDVAVQWSSIQGKPASSPTQIDSAVSNSHTHANKTQLDKVGQDANGEFTYGGVLPHTKWDSIGW